MNTVVESNVVQNLSVQHDFVQSQHSYSSLCLEVQAHNRKVLHDALFDLGVTEVVVEYYGGGDSGEVSDICCQPQALASILKSHQVEVQDACRGFDGSAYVCLLKNYSCSLWDALDAFVLLWLEIEHGGWENNEGGSGQMFIDVLADHFALNHSEYYQESTEYEYTLD